MPKRVKIKRYGRIYRGSPPFSFLRTLGAVAVVAVLGFIGWSAYTPVANYLAGLGDSMSRPVSVDAPVDPAAPAVPEVVAPIVPETPAAPVKAAYLPLAATNSATLDATLDTFAAQGLNAVMIDLKDASGIVLYKSALPSTTQAKAVAENALDLKAFCEKATAKNMTVIGRMNAFRDPNAPGKIEDAGIKYVGTDMLWLDNSRDAGGKAWLNPYSTPAKSYLFDIMNEAISLGVRDILLDSVSFPTGYGQEFCSFGDTGGLTRPEALSAFLHEAQEKVTAAKGALSVYIPATAALGANDAYYGANPLTLGGDVTLGVMPSQFGDAFTQGDFKLTAPLLTPRDTVSAVLKAVGPQLANRKITALLQGYTDDRTLAHNKVYTAEDINAQVAALTENGVESYIIYSPAGSYPQ